MALVQCSECGNSVSENATMCPYCGNPINTAHTTIEKTSKKYKGQQAGGCALSIFGVLIAASGTAEGGTIGGIMIVVGLIMYFGSKVEAWWHHG